MAGLGEMGDEAVVHKVLTLERDLVAARFRHSLNQLENTASLRGLRREIARLRTEMRRREREQELPKDSLLHRFRGSFQGESAASGEPAEAGEKGGFLSGIVDRLTGKD